MRHHLWLARLLDGAGLPDYGRPHLTGDPVRIYSTTSIRRKPPRSR
jgi:hypothetical protein